MFNATPWGGADAQDQPWRPVDIDGAAPPRGRKTLLQLIYCSAAANGAGDDLPALCAQSTHHNRSQEITGVLLLHEGFYLQALEGPRVMVEDTFLRIITDRRHREVRILSRRLAGFREFGEFAMIECREGRHKGRVLRQIHDIITPGAIRRLYEDRFLPLAIAA